MLLIARASELLEHSTNKVSSKRYYRLRQSRLGGIVNQRYKISRITENQVNCDCSLLEHCRQDCHALQQSIFPDSYYQ